MRTIHSSAFSAFSKWIANDYAVVSMDMDKAIRTAVDSGKVELGADKAKKLSLTGKAKMIIVAANCPEALEKDLRRYGELSSIPVVFYAGTSIELGTVCGKPFPVSALSVVEEGSSDVLKAAEKK